MKRIVSIIVVILIASLALTSCAATTMLETTNTTGQQTPIKKDYSALIYGFSDGVPSAKKDIDLSADPVEKNPPNITTVAIGDKTYIGKYEGSSNSKYYDDETNTYTCSTQNGSIVNNITYKVNAKTQDVVFYMLSRRNDKVSDYEGLKTYTKEECFELAKEFMKQYVTNIDNYTVISEYEKTDSIYGTWYHYRFVECIGDLQIGNIAIIDINMYGEVLYFTRQTHIEDVEAFEDSGYIETIDWDAVDEAIGKKALEAFTARTNGQTQYTHYRVYSSDKSKNIKTLVRMADGRYALSIDAYVLVSTDEYPDRYESFEALMLIYLD